MQRFNTAGASGTTAPGFNAGDGSIIRGLYLQGGYAGTEGEVHGIHLRARALIEDCFITGFQGDGIYCNVAAGGSPEGNANNIVINRVRIEHCRKGLFFDGADSNASLITMLDASHNRTWGVDDSSFLGNTYVGCHAAANGWDGALGSIPTGCTFGGNRYFVKAGQAAGATANAPTGTAADNAWWGYSGPGGVYNGVPVWASGTTFREGGAYKTDNPNASNLFLGCYSEGDQNPAQLNNPTLVIGGLHGAQVKGSGTLVTGDTQGNTLKTEIFKARAPGSSAQVEMTPNGFDFDDYYQFMRQGNDFAFTVLNSGSPSNWAMRWTGDGTSHPVGNRKMVFDNGFGLGQKKVLSGTAAPTSGAYNQGDMMFNSAPTAGGPTGWMCVAGGTPGTWKAMGSLAA